MPENEAALERVSGPMRQPLEQYAELVKQLAGENARALTLFGAIAAGVFDPNRHTVRNVLVLEGVDLSFLRRLGEHGLKLGKARIAAPLIMTPGYVKASLDTFPLELLEIKQNHVTVFGDDYFDDLAFDDAHVRLQCERELKAILIGLRQGLLAAAGREKFVGALEQDVAEGLLRTLRGLLWLKGQKDARPAAAVVDAIEKLVDRKLTGVRNALDPSATHGWAEFEQLYREVETLGETANDW